MNLKALEQRYFLDGYDMWLAFGVFVSKGSGDLLKYPPKKESITHDWQDSNGVDVDLSRVFFDMRKVAISFCIIADSEADFWAKHNNFIGQWIKPGLRRLTLASHPSKSYFVYYEECNSYEDVTKLLGLAATRTIAMRFNMVIVEPQPDNTYKNTYIVDEQNKFIIA